MDNVEWLGVFGQKTDLKLPLFSDGIAAGFPSPADDYIERKLDLNEYLIRHPAATFFVRVEGESMINAGIHPGDILIVDRALEPGDNKIVVALLEGEFTVKRLRKTCSGLFLLAENPAYAPIEIQQGANFEIWGVVAFVIHQAE
ncbi:MAG: translesion error-prone DNA polymerase V autoproteolytic subunit [Candidatus Wallbacteria bacterium]|nr:translesion error-prone DNA polymerase V autoproteolytic subunit [Candidatus Wallbacteria bacterium]